MTYCIAIKTEHGLLALSDGRITAGTQVSSARKVELLGEGGARFFVMTSGLRSVRDKTLAYLQLRKEGGKLPFATMLEAVREYTHCLRQVEEEDRTHLERAGLTFNLHSLVGGQLADDAEPELYLVYPEGNWIQVEKRSPYAMIGEIGYGKPILDRTLHYEIDMRTALKIAYLSFDATMFSSSDVGFPIDILTYHTSDRQWRETHLEDQDMKDLRHWWNENIKHLAHKTPDGVWLKGLLP